MGEYAYQRFEIVCNQILKLIDEICEPAQLTQAEKALQLLDCQNQEYLKQAEALELQMSLWRPEQTLADLLQQNMGDHASLDLKLQGRSSLPYVELVIQSNAELFGFVFQLQSKKIEFHQ